MTARPPAHPARGGEPAGDAALQASSARRRASTTTAPTTHSAIPISTAAFHPAMRPAAALSGRTRHGRDGGDPERRTDVAAGVVDPASGTRVGRGNARDRLAGEGGVDQPGPGARDEQPGDELPDGGPGGQQGKQRETGRYCQQAPGRPRRTGTHVATGRIRSPVASGE